MSAASTIASALTRAWVRLYTSGMPVDLRESRRAEIDADLWDHDQDARENGVPRAVFAMEILLRALLGVPDDLSWRFEAIRIRRAASLHRRIPMMALSVTQIRWMGICGLLGGILWAGNALTMPAEPRVIVGYGHIALSMLFIAGLLGFYAHQRDRAGKVAKAGFILLFTSSVAWSGLNLLGTGFGVDDGALLMNLLGVAFALPLAPGFLLLGIGLKGPIRRVPLAIGIVLLAKLLLPQVGLPDFFPSAAGFFGIRGDSPGRTAVSFLVGIGLALMGYSVFRNAAPTPPSGRRHASTIKG